MTRAELKNNAKHDLRGNWGWSVGIALVYEVLTWLLDFVQGNDAVWITIYSIIAGLITISWEYTSLALVDGDKENANFGGILASVRDDRFGSSFVAMILIYIYTVLWSILLIIPGIIKIYSYSQTYYILKDKLDSGQKISANEAITESRKLMNGHKMEYFILQLSFLGWLILGVITLGIAYLWVLPYMYTTDAQYYRHLAGDRYRTTGDDRNDTSEDTAATFEEK